MASGTMKIVGVLRRLRWSRQITGYLFLAPALSLLTLAIIYPLFSTFRLSFTEISPRDYRVTFVGLKHYAEILQDGTLRRGVLNTVIFTVASLVLHLLTGGLFALLLNNERWANRSIRNLIRGLLILPWLFSTAASALIWGLLYHPFGPINYVLKASGLTSRAVEFLANPSLALWSLIVVNVWKTFPFYMVMILGGLQSIPVELYEAARVDGANAIQRFSHITLPLLRPILLAISILDIITTFGQFDLPKLMTWGGPVGVTTTVGYYVWRVGIRDANFGYGSAICVLMLIGLGCFVWIYMRILGKEQT
jgi:multiple sugar transport system permease protein